MSSSILRAEFGNLSELLRGRIWPDSHRCQLLHPHPPLSLSLSLSLLYILYYGRLHYTTLHHARARYNTLHHTTLHYTTPPHATLVYTTIRYITIIGKYFKLFIQALFYHLAINLAVYVSSGHVRLPGQDIYPHNSETYRVMEVT